MGLGYYKYTIKRCTWIIYGKVMQCVWFIVCYVISFIDTFMESSGGEFVKNISEEFVCLSECFLIALIFLKVKLNLNLFGN